MKTKIRLLFIRGETRQAKTETKVYSTPAPHVSAHFQEPPSFFRRVWLEKILFVITRIYGPQN